MEATRLQGPVALALSTLATQAFAVAPGATETPPALLGAGHLLQVVAALALVLVLIGGLAYVAQRMRLGPQATGRHLRIVDALALGPRERLMLVEVDGERVLIGIAGGRLERLHAIAGPRPAGEFATLLRASEAAPPAAGESP